MIRILLLVAAAAFFVPHGWAQTADEEPLDFAHFTVGGAATMILPQGGARLPRRSGAAIRAGWYLTEFWAIEGEAAWLEDRIGLSAKALWHWWGYERFDPFFTFGAKGWLSDGQAGPCGGAGAFWHLTEQCSLRADADATLGLDSEADAIFSISIGAQFSF